jgi:GT2 family glycosyltransferase
MKEPIVSIVTPSYNAEDYIERAIRSVLDQDVESLEHIVVDGGSTDGTVDILRRYPHLRWISEPDEGQSDALNKGFRMARGEILGWLNADDTYTPGAVQTGVDYLKSHPECDIVYGDCNIRHNDGSLLTVFESHQTEGYEQLLGGVIHTPAVFWRRRLFDRIGYLDESLHYNMDNEFWLRAAAVADQHYISHPLANFFHRSGSKSMSARAEFGPEMCHIYEEAFEQEPYRSQIPSDVKQRTLARYYWHSGIELTLAGDPEQARHYLDKAVNQLGVLDFPDIVSECVVVRYEEREVLPWRRVQSLVDQLPIDEDTREKVNASVKRDYEQLRFYAAHNRRDWTEVRVSGWHLVMQNPKRLGDRGFWSIWGESLLGTTTMSIARKLV